MILREEISLVKLSPVNVPGHTEQLPEVGIAHGVDTQFSRAERLTIGQAHLVDMVGIIAYEDEGCL